MTFQLLSYDPQLYITTGDDFTTLPVISLDINN